MPFIKQEIRKEIAEGKHDWLYTNEEEPGNLCYMSYKLIVEKWRENPKWTTADYIYKTVIRQMSEAELEGDISVQSALGLAWQVFFQLHVMPYELKKREENGDI